MKRYTKAEIRALVDALPENYRTPDLDGIIRQLVREGADVSCLRDFVLAEQDLHRIYYYVNLKQLRDVNDRMQFIHENLLFSDWWHTDQLIGFVKALDFDRAIAFAKDYVNSEDPFIRRWGYVLFISSLGRGHAAQLLQLMKNDTEYYVQMAQAWLIAELAIDEPQAVFDWMRQNELSYSINGKAIQKICDSYRISDAWKTRFKRLRAERRTHGTVSPKEGPGL